MSSTPAKRKNDQVVIDNLNQSFIPKKKMTHHHGRLTLQLHPDVANEMMDPERTHAFNINKQAAQNEPALSHASRSATMGEKHDCTNVADVELGQWKDEGLALMKTNDNVTVKSHHDHTGAPIANCLDINSQLKPLANSTQHLHQSNVILKSIARNSLK